MTRLLRMFIMSMLILYFGLLTAPAWSTDAPRHDHILRLGIITMYHASPLPPSCWSACKISR